MSGLFLAVVFLVVRQVLIPLAEEAEQEKQRLCAVNDIPQYPEQI